MKIMSSTFVKDLRALRFEGGRNGFWLWKNRFIGYAERKGYDDLLVEDPNNIFTNIAADGTVTAVTDLSPDDKAKYEMHLQALSDLKMVMESHVDFTLVLQTQDMPRYPKGNIAAAWAELLDRYEPTTDIGRANLLREMHQVVAMPVSKDPEALVSEVLWLRRDLREHHSLDVDHTTVVHKILNSLPSEYKGTKEII